MPINLEKVGKDELDLEILRAGIIAELDAINLYEQMAQMYNKNLKRILLDIAKEEKAHVLEKVKELAENLIKLSEEYK